MNNSELYEEYKESSVGDILIEGLFIDGGHHKQWIIEQALIKLGVDLNRTRKIFGNWESGIAP